MNKINANQIKIQELKKTKEELLPQLEEARENCKKSKEFLETIGKYKKEIADDFLKEEKETEQEILARIKKDGLNYLPSYFFGMEAEHNEDIKKLKNAIEVFEEKIVDKKQREKDRLERNIIEIDKELTKIERIELRKEIRKRGRELLPCVGYNKTTIGCLRDDDGRSYSNWCKNCEYNYLTPLEYLIKKTKQNNIVLDGCLGWIATPKDRENLGEKRCEENFNYIRKVCGFFIDNQLTKDDTFYREITEKMLNQAWDYKSDDKKLLTDFINDIENQVENGLFYSLIKDEPRDIQFNRINKLWEKENN